MIKNGGNLCYKLDFAAATSCRDTQASSKAGCRARVGSAYIVGGWRSLSEVMFNASWLQRRVGSGHETTVPSELYAVQVTTNTR